MILSRKCWNFILTSENAEEWNTVTSQSPAFWKHKWDSDPLWVWCLKLSDNVHKKQMKTHHVISWALIQQAFISL